MGYQLSNTSAISKAFCMFNPSEKLGWSEGSAYMGRSGIYAMPIFIGVETALNQHVCVIGMSGSGKTFLMKNLVSRFSYSGRKVLVIDWNGEYSGVVSYLYGAEYSIDDSSQIASAIRLFESKPMQAGAASINLSLMRDEVKKRAAARLLMKHIAGNLGAAPALGSKQSILVLDEAWKALGGDELSTLFREGRKYGLGIVIASQTASDMGSDILANCATVIVFRIQNKEDFSTLSSAQIFDGDMLSKLAGLARGSCIVSMAMGKDRPRQAVYVPEVDGTSYSLCYISGDEMEVTIPIETMMEKLDIIVDDASKKHAIENYIIQNRGRVGIQGLIGELASKGITRSSIVVYLRSLGVPDNEIIEAYRREV
ncbi:MAG: ATP-binding protein [Candidatus Micrarchaeia archaeon]